MKITTAGILALCVCAAPRMAAAQTMQWTDKGYISVSGGGQTGSHDLSGSGSFPLYDETATFSSTAKVTGGGLFDIGGAYRVWGHNLLAGLTYSRMSSKSGGTLTGSVPDPVFFDRPRAVTKDFSGLTHAENQVSINAIWMWPVINKLDVGLSAGPTIFSVTQDAISTLTVTEPGPSVTSAFTTSKKSAVGFNAGIDVQYMLQKKWGIGVLVRYAGGSVSLPETSKKLSVGGFQMGAGVRVRF